MGGSSCGMESPCLSSITSFVIGLNGTVNMQKGKCLISVTMHPYHNQSFYFSIAV